VKRAPRCASSARRRPTRRACSAAIRSTQRAVPALPECDQFMLRTNYKRSSGVILDECRAHGTWLDADELEQVAGFILAGGTPRRCSRQEHDGGRARGAGGSRARGSRRASISTAHGAHHRSLLELF
jgi:Zn-finger nucleic acid-binding protein